MKAPTVLSQQGQHIERRSQAPLPMPCFTLPDTHCFSRRREDCWENGHSIFFGHSVLFLAAEKPNKRPRWAQQLQGVSTLHILCDKTGNLCQRGKEQGWRALLYGKHLLNQWTNSLNTPPGYQDSIIYFFWRWSMEQGAILFPSC